VIGAGFFYVQAATNLSGRILLQVEDEGQAWYVNPLDERRYYLGRPDDAFGLMRDFGLGVSNKDLSSFQSYGVPDRLSGRIILQVEDKGQAFYVDPVDMKLYSLGRPYEAFQVIRNRGLGITTANLSKITPAQVTEIVEGASDIKHFDFKYQNQDYYLNLSLSQDIYNIYSNSPKVYKYPVTQTPESARESFYEMFLTVKEGDTSLNDITKTLKIISDNRSWSDDQLAEFVLTFVQYIPYDQVKSESNLDNPYYPYETLYLQKGVCSDKAFLASQLLDNLGYGTAILDFPDINHATVGIACPLEDSLNNSGYCYAETTNYFPIGVIPRNINGQAEDVDLNDDFFDSSSLGKIEMYQKTGGKLYTGLDNTKTQIQDLKDLKICIDDCSADIIATKANLEDREADIVATKALLDAYMDSGQIDSYNALVPSYNEKADLYNVDLLAYREHVNEYNKEVEKFNKLNKDFYQQ